MNKNKKGNVVVTTIMIVVAMAIASGTTYFLATKLAAPEQKTMITAPTPQPSSTPVEQPVAGNDISQAEKNADSELVSIDEEWNLYTNSAIGFSMKVPKKSYLHQSEQEEELIVLTDTATNRVYIGPKNIRYDFFEKDISYPASFSNIDDDPNSRSHGSFMLVNIIPMKNTVSDINNFLKIKSPHCPTASNGTLFKDYAQFKDSKFVDTLSNYTSFNPSLDCLPDTATYTFYSIAKQKLIFINHGNGDDVFNRKESMNCKVGSKDYDCTRKGLVHEMLYSIKF